MKESLLVKEARNKKSKKTIIISTAIIMPLILIYAGHFLFSGREEPMPGTPPGMAQEETTQAPVEPPENLVKHIHRSETINGLKQEINILEVDPGLPGVKIRPVLSYDLIYGFELLSEMAARKNAYAAVNGGFFRDFGLPSGMVVIKGELYAKSTGQYPVFVIRNGKADLREIDSELYIEYRKGTQAVKPGSSDNAKADSDDNEILSIDNINFPASGRQTVVYTPVYGRNNRAQKKNITATVKNGIVTRIADYTGEAAIPEDGMLISFFDTGKYAGIELPIAVGDSVKLVHKPDMTGDVEAYECGSWLVRDGLAVVKDKDAWVGVLTNRDPRTAVGIKEDGTVLLLTVDGRQPGYSAGFTGKELVEYLISCGVKNAAMLDGGASTEMLLEGKLISRPSHKGEERPLAGGILVLLEE